MKKIIQNIVTKIFKDPNFKNENQLLTRQENYFMEINNKLTVTEMKKNINNAYKIKHGYAMNWSHPQSFTQKIMWLKLNYQNPLIMKCCDKFAVKEYVSDVIGEKYIVPTIDWWTDPNDIDFTKLPNSFVLKVNWSSGYNIIVRDKTKIDEKEIRAKLKRWIKSSSNCYYKLYNWGYKYVNPIIYAEKYISEVNDNSQLYDYKFFCYDGICKNLFITTDRFTKKTNNWFDSEFNELPFFRGKVSKAKGGVKKPKYFEKMKELAEILAKPFPFVRVDFYEVGDEIYVGEMTFYPGGGILKFIPRQYDFELGSLINLPQPMNFDELKDYEKMEPKQAYYLEDKISINEKIRYCEHKALAQLMYFPNLKNPKSLNEKLLWLALHYKNPLISKLTDKYEVKKYLAENIGEEYVIPSIGCYTDPNDIPWNELPNKFVIKSTTGWSSKQVKIILNKQYENENVIKGICSEWLYPWNTYRYANMCITDQKVKPRILIEELLGDGKQPPIDYKIYGSYGENKMMLIVTGRGEKQANTFVNPKTWEIYKAVRYNKKMDRNINKPKNLDKMLEIASKISNDFPFVRIDFYEVNNKVYVGEIQFDPGLFLRFTPESFDFDMGKIIDLKNIK